MVQRRARRGRNAGGYFWGCPNYPGCKGILDIGVTEVEAPDVEERGSRTTFELQPSPAPRSATTKRRVTWVDGTLRRNGWDCQYRNIGGSFRAVPLPDEAIERVQCVLDRASAGRERSSGR